MYHKLKSNIWCMVSEIWSATYRIFSHFGPFSPFYPPPLPLPNNLSKSKFQKKWKKKTPGDIIILLICTINEYYSMSGSWDMEHNWQNCFSFWVIFCPFTPLTTEKIKILKKQKKCLEIHHFTQVHQKSWSYTILFLRYGTWQM